MKYLNEMLEHDKSQGIRHNKDIKKAIAKHRRIHKRAEDGLYIYAPERVESVINFTENEFWKTTGVLELIKLNAAQKWWLELIFGYYTSDGDILINEIFLNIIRGAGKSTLMAAIETYWLLYGGNYGGESLVIAYDNIQASHVFEQVRNQLTSGDGVLSKLADAKILRTTKTGITFEANKNSFRKQTNDVHRSQGGNSSLNIFDELHIYKNDVVSAVNKGSRQKQKSWRSIYITSGGIVRGYLYDDMIKRFTSDKEYESDRSIALLYRLEEAEQVKDYKNWTMAAPMLFDGLPSLESVKEEYEIASGDPALQTQFLAYNMGLATQDKTKYITEEETGMTDYDFNDVWFGADVNIGVDLSLVGDLTAITFLTEKNGITYAHCEALGSRNTLSQMPDVIAEQLKHFPDLTITDSAYIRAQDVVDIVDRFLERSHCNLSFVGYDPARYENLKQLINDYFFDVDEERQQKIRQGFAMSEYIKLMKEKLQDKTLVHNSPILKWSLTNFAVKIGTMGDLMPAKITDAEKIDPVVSLVNALEVTVLKGI